MTSSERYSGMAICHLGIDKRREDTQDVTMTIKILSKLNYAAFANDFLIFSPPYFSTKDYTPQL
ncbi:hypothetical protein M441DRAFT_290323 [Trichoderma asperellum CBS 433.97]|uniref:Uncharacterized protein n=1 Tax=Trichoderma asperellum (strain ATCC 204424 / CBS 433.97 / NBRC 101777) TaxID=1042311 RepID=A0A2T3YU23_TRIA4|nr:hypothetical protein M441DRAFT_290323 [Trichoderma asperellum CBS 433.97]PTB36006.1 hypothetical protein M441DRAFT_290323 [Trichoderma asperellum CBS 433.97]